MRPRRRTVTGSICTAVTFCLLAACEAESRGQEGGIPDAELERRVEELLPKVGELARLPSDRAPAVRRATAATLEAYLLERLDTEYPGDSLSHLTQAYQAFGLLPDTVDLRVLLVDLMLEQAIGYYDPARDVFFVREDQVPSVALDVVLVHELVHALQDQRLDLDSLIRNTASNDARAAAQAAMEGHATVTMFAYGTELAAGGPVSPADLPELGPEMASMLADPSTMPELARAPRIVREPLLFAYLGGARYVQRLWRAQTEQPPPLDRWLPESTEQLLHTEKLLVERDSPSRLELYDPSAGWEVIWAHDLGELEIRIYFEEHLGDRATAERAAAGWDADAYVLLSDGEHLALVWYTGWDSDADADEFVDAYRAAFMNRFPDADAELRSGERQARLERLNLDGLPVVAVVEAAPGLELDFTPSARAIVVEMP